MITPTELLKRIVYYDPARVNASHLNGALGSVSSDLLSVPVRCGPNQSLESAVIEGDTLMSQVIEKERERCAKIAENVAHFLSDTRNDRGALARDWAQSIASAIRLSRAAVEPRPAEQLYGRESQAPEQTDNSVFNCRSCKRAKPKSQYNSATDTCVSCVRGWMMGESAGLSEQLPMRYCNFCHEHVDAEKFDERLDICMACFAASWPVERNSNNQPAEPKRQPSIISKCMRCKSNPITIWEYALCQPCAERVMGLQPPRSKPTGPFAYDFPRNPNLETHLL